MRFPAPSVMVFAVLGAVLFAPGCKTLQGLVGDNSEPDYAKDPETNLKKAHDATVDHDFATAEKFYEYVKQKYQYQEVAREAELGLADNSFEKESYEESRARYADFIKLHPTHPRVDYAAFRGAWTHLKEFKLTASDFFIFPPAYEKDEAEVHACVQAMKDFEKTYPNSEYLSQAHQVEKDAQKLLAAHEMYVADFYYKRSRYLAAVNRWKGVVASFPNLGPDQDALFKLHDTYLSKMKDPQHAQEALQTLIQRYPHTPAAERAQRMLKS